MRWVQPVQPKNIAIYFEPQSLIQRWMIRVHLVQVDTLTRSICCIRFPAIVFVAMCIPCFTLPPSLGWVNWSCFFLLHFIQVVCVSTTMQVHKKCDCIDISAKCTLKHVVAVARTCGMPLMAVMTKKSLSKTISKYFKSNTNQIEPAMAMGWALNDRWFWITTATASQTTTAAKNAMVQKISILEIEWIFTWHWYRCFCFVPN